MLKALLSALFLLTILFCNQAAANTNHIIEQAYFEDQSNSLSVDSVVTEKFTPFQDWLTKGYSPSSYWIKLKIRPSERNLVLRIRPTFVETVQLFDPVDIGSDRITGAKHFWRESEVQSYNHSFNLGVIKEEKILFLKVKSNRSYLLAFDVMPISEYLGVENTDGLLYFGYIVFTLALALGLFGAWLTNRERVLGAFVIQQFIAFLHTLFVVGYARFFLDKYIDVSTINYFSYVLVVGYPLIAIFANKLLFEDYGLRPTFRHLFNFLFCISLIIFTLLIFGHINTALRLNAQLVMSAIFLLFFTAWFGTLGGIAKTNINLPINYLRVYCTLNIVMWSISVLPLLGVIQGNDLTVHSYLLYNVLSGLIFFWLLQYRAKSILKNELAKSAALKEEAEYEKSRREDQGKLMAMLTHEIRTPLSVLKLVVDRKVSGSDLEDYANRAVNNIDAIIDKCIQLDQLDLNALKIHKTRFNFSELLRSTIADAQSERQFLITSPDSMSIHSDSDIVRVILSNLITNAEKYSIPHKKILISSELIEGPYSSQLQFRIQNEFGDIGAPDAAQVFDKYYRASSAVKISGSGLGLFLVKELTQVLEGQVECSVNQNSITFTVWIPA